MMKKINILQAFLTNDGGLSSYMLNNYIHIDKNRFNFTFITSEEIFNDEAKYRKLGADFLYANKRYGYLVYLIQLSKIFKESTCDILHLNFSAANLPVMFLAKIFFKGKIIIHSHTAGVVDENIFKRNIKFLIHKFCKNAIPYVGDYFFACSDKAAEWMYPAVIVNTKRYIVCKNAVDINKFKFDKFKRINLRRKNNITDTCIIIGHVAGFVYQKNHIFVIEILKALQQITDNFKIFFVGSGPELKTIRNKVNINNLQNNVKFLGQRNDVQDLMKIFDILILPSRLEGLGFVAIEAQCAGLPCLLSDGVPREVAITNLVHFLSLEENPEKWARKILQYSSQKRIDISKDVLNSGYDINDAIKKLENIYMKILNIK